MEAEFDVKYLKPKEKVPSGGTTILVHSFIEFP